MTLVIISFREDKILTTVSDFFLIFLVLLILNSTSLVGRQAIDNLQAEKM